MKKRVMEFLFGGPGAATWVGDVGLAILRIGVGLLIAFGHGMGKIFPEAGFGPPQRFVQTVSNMGFPAPTLFAWCAALTEFLGGILLAAGLLTRPMALLLCFNMSVAAFIRHRTDPLFDPEGPSKEFALLYLIPFLALLLIGGGRYAIDRFLRKQTRTGTGK